MTVISPRTEEPFRQLFRDTIISRAGRQRPSTSTAPGSFVPIAAPIRRRQKGRASRSSGDSVANCVASSLGEQERKVGKEGA